MNFIDNFQELKNMLLETKLNHLYLISLTKIYEQIDWNADIKNSGIITQGNFQWDKWS